MSASVPCISLSEDEHIEWSILSKLAHLNQSRQAITENWDNQAHKMETLRQRARGGKLIGVAAREALTFAGHSNLIWVDIDSPDSDAVREWLRRQTIFPQGSYRRIKSSTWNSHVYIRTDRPLKESWQIGLRRILRESMGDELFLDRVYGPESTRIVFLPMLSLRHATFPQYLMKGINEVFTLPVKKIIHPAERALQRKGRKHR